MPDTQFIRVKSLVVGQALEEDLVDAYGRLLVRAGVKITPLILEIFDRRGVTRVALRPAPPSPPTSTPPSAPPAARRATTRRRRSAADPAA